MTKLDRRLVLVAAGALAASAAAASAFGGQAPQVATPQRVTVTMTEFKFALKPKTAKKGVVVFTAVNKGTVAHDFKIMGKKTPNVAAGARRTLRVTFKKAGRYKYLCTLPSHAQAGMKGTLIVR